MKESNAAMINPSLKLKDSNMEGNIIAPKADPKKVNPPNNPPKLMAIKGITLCKINTVDAILPNITETEAIANPTYQFFIIPRLKLPLKDLLKFLG